VDKLRTDILGVGFDDISAQQAVSQAIEMIREGRKAYIVTPNPEIVWQCRKDEALRAAVNNAGLVLPDGIGIIIAARILGTPLNSGRVPGIDFASGIFGIMAESGGSVYLFGSKPGVAEEAGQRLASMYPGLVIVGFSDGYCADNEPIIRKINESNPDLLLVCLGFPKQEFWMAENAGRLNATLCVGLGGSIDVFAGRVKRAPAFFRKMGLEWLYRLIREPWRTKRMIKLPLFVFMTLFERMRRLSGRNEDKSGV